MNKTFLDLENSLTEEERLEIDAAVLSGRFLFLVDQLRKDAGLTRAELAENLSVTPSHLSQLFNGDRLINLKTLAKVQQVFDIDFTPSVTLREPVNAIIPNVQYAAPIKLSPRVQHKTDAIAIPHGAYVNMKPITNLAMAGGFN